MGTRRRTHERDRVGVELVRPAVVGSYHKLSKKHMAAYLDEFAFRFNNRDNPFLFRDTILRLIEGDALPFKELVATER